MFARFYAQLGVCLQSLNFRENPLFATYTGRYILMRQYKTIFSNSAEGDLEIFSLQTDSFKNT